MIELPAWIAFLSDIFYLGTFVYVAARYLRGDRLRWTDKEDR